MTRKLRWLLPFQALDAVSAPDRSDSRVATKTRDHQRF